MMLTDGFLIFSLVLVDPLFLQLFAVWLCKLAEKTACLQLPDPVGLTVISGAPVVLLVT